MAERRMFSKKIINSARFLKMPPSTQNLYFHLGMQADDDGIVEAFTTIRTIGATEDDLKLLVAKGFVVVLNEDLVTYINDWRENNQLRSDRKINSIYKDLLLQVLPDVKLLEPTEKAYKRKKKESLTTICRQSDDQVTTNCPPSIVEDSIVEDSIVEDSIVENSKEVSKGESEITYEDMEKKYG